MEGAVVDAVQQPAAPVRPMVRALVIPLSFHAPCWVCGLIAPEASPVSVFTGMASCTHTLVAWMPGRHNNGFAEFPARLSSTQRLKMIAGDGGTRSRGQRDVGPRVACCSLAVGQDWAPSGSQRALALTQRYRRREWAARKTYQRPSITGASRSAHLARPSVPIARGTEEAANARPLLARQPLGQIALGRQSSSSDAAAAVEPIEARQESAWRGKLVK